MLDLRRDLVFTVLQFLEEENLMESMHSLEREAAYFFNVKYFEDIVLAGEWEEVEKYLSGFINVKDNDLSMETFFKIWKLKYIEALDRQEKAKALDILQQELSVFLDSEHYKELTQMITLTNIREHVDFSNYDCQAQRTSTWGELRTLIMNNPSFQGKLAPPTLGHSALKHMARFTEAALEPTKMFLHNFRDKPGFF